jgi:hypothetical protein
LDKNPTIHWELLFKKILEGGYTMRNNGIILVFAALCAMLFGCAHETINARQEVRLPQVVAPEGVVITPRSVRVTFYMSIEDIPQKDGIYQWQVVIDGARERFSQWLAGDWPDKETVALFRGYMKDNDIAVEDLRCSYVWGVSHMTATIRLCLDESADAQVAGDEAFYFDLEW